MQDIPGGTFIGRVKNITGAGIEAAVFDVRALVDVVNIARGCIESGAVFNNAIDGVSRLVDSGGERPGLPAIGAVHAVDVGIPGVHNLRTRPVEIERAGVLQPNALIRLVLRRG